MESKDTEGFWKSDWHADIHLWGKELPCWQWQEWLRAPGLERQWATSKFLNEREKKSFLVTVFHALIYLGSSSQGRKDLELLVLLSPPPRCWYYKRALPCQVNVKLGSQLTALWALLKYSTNRATPTACPNFFNRKFGNEEDLSQDR